MTDVTSCASDARPADMIAAVARRIASPELIGREAELETIWRALGEAEAGRGRAVLIGGEAGIGKSRVVVEALERARARGAVVLVGGCIGLAEGALPFAPIVEAIRPLLTESPLGVRPQLAAAGGGNRGEPATSDPRRDEVDAPLVQVAHALGLPGARLAGVAESGELRPEWVRSHLYESFLELLRRLSADRPVVLAVEDLHWGDESTRELLAFLIRNARSERLLTLVTFRSDELHRRHPLLPWLIEMDRSPAVERIELARLGRDAVARQIAAIVGRRPEASLVDRVYRRCEGNPLFAEELLAAGLDAEGLPPTLREVLAARLSRVSEPTLRLLGVAAVVGRRVDHELLARLVDLSDADLDDALQEAVAAQLLVVDDASPAGRYAFRHALIAEAAAETVLPNRRRRLHAAIAAALETDPVGEEDVAGHLAEVAHHWFEARELDQAFAASVAAGDAARDGGAYAVALRQYERAVELWDVVREPERAAGIDRIELMRRTAQAAQLSGEFARASQVLRDGIVLAEERGDRIRAGLLSERLGRSLWTGAAVDQARVAYRRAIELVPESPPSADRARVLGGYAQVLMLGGRAAESKPIAEEALRIAREVGDRGLEGDILATLGVDVGFVGDEDDAIDLLRQAVAIAEEGHDLDAIGRAYANLSSVLDQAGRVQESIDVAMAGGRRMRELGWGVTYAPFVELNAADALVRLGRLEEALNVASELEPIAHGTGLVFANRVLAAIFTVRGETERAADAIRVSLDGLVGREAQFTGPLAATQIDLAGLTGDHESGRRVTDAVLPVLTQTDDFVQHAIVLNAALRLEADVAERARARRDDASLRTAVGRGESFLAGLHGLSARALNRTQSEALGVSVAVGEAEMARLRGEPDVAAWRKARTATATRGPLVELPYVTFRLAEALLSERAGRDEAAELLAEAHRAASGMGARPLREAIEGLAARSRLVIAEKPAPAAAAPRPASVRGAGGGTEPATAAYGLSTREVDVLKLVAAGRTNRQIAEALFISESTAGVHVSHILAKLDVAGRVEAATIAARLGLVDEAAPR